MVGSWAEARLGRKERAMKAYNLDATLKVENDEQWEAMQDAFTAFLEALTAAGVMHEAYLSLPEPFLIPGAPDGPITPADVNTGGTVRFDLDPRFCGVPLTSKSSCLRPPGHEGRHSVQQLEIDTPVNREHADSVDRGAFPGLPEESRYIPRSPEEATGRMSDAIAEQAMKIERSKCCGATILRSDVDPTNAVCSTCYGDVS